MSDMPVARPRARRRLSSAVVAGAVLIIPLAACTHHGWPPHRPTTSGPNTTHATRPPTTAPPTSSPTTRPPTTAPPTTTPTANEATFQMMDGMIMLQGSVKAGRNTLHFTNTGTKRHEVIFVKADDGAKLPTSANGAWNEAAMPAGSIIGEVELNAGASSTKAFTFTSGKWVAVCNIVSGTSSHYAAGMWMNFTVS